MSNSGPLKVSISFSHKDESYIEAFRTHVSPLKTKGFVEDWYDRMIVAGTDFQPEIDQNLKDSDIVCLFISANFLASGPCMKEKLDALQNATRERLTIVPIILTPCGWLDDEDLAPLLALPKDGNPVSDFQDPNTAWKQVYDGLKGVIARQAKLKQLAITDVFGSFLEDSDLLSKAHSQKQKVLLSDVFVYPEFGKFDELKEYESKVQGAALVDEFLKSKKIVIAGKSQSGKTSLCKNLFADLRNLNFIPIYVHDKTHQFHGSMATRLRRAFHQQYSGAAFEDVNQDRIVPIIDDFHFVREKEKHIGTLAAYTHQIITVDDIFCLNIKDETLLNAYTYFEIEELNPVLRNELIRKWIGLREAPGAMNRENSFYKTIDEQTELVNATLGKILGKGIMPAFPFFVLSIISTYETYSKPLNEEITSQGYCYQAFIYMYLRKQGVKNDEVDTYINFLDEFAFFFFKGKGTDITEEKFYGFIESYMAKYNMPVPIENLVKVLLESTLISKSNFNTYGFGYDYLYFFFVAKYLAEHAEESIDTIDEIIHNLHKEDNSYIAVFISHHSKNDKVLDDIMLNAMCLFESSPTATLSSEELSFFDKQAEIVVKASLPSANQTPAKTRNDQLEHQSTLEDERAKEEDEASDSDTDTDELEKELRRSIKTVEVVGSIIKNRAGSLTKPKLNSLFEEAMNVHLRIIGSFLELIRTEEAQDEIVKSISSKLEALERENAQQRKDNKQPERPITAEKLEKISQKIFWNMNFFFIYGFIHKTVTSLGSDKLTAIVSSVCEKINTPAAFLVKQGILMWYKKNLQIELMSKRMGTDDFSEVSQKIMRFLIVNHCTMHKVDFIERQKIENEFHIPSNKLLHSKTK